MKADSGTVLAPIGREHLSELTSLEEKCFSCPWSRQSFEECLENGRYYFVGAFEGGALIGYGGISVLFDEGEVCNVAVSSEYRGRSVGRMILSALCDEAKARGAAILHLEVREGNSPARALYDSFGFFTDGIRKNYYTRPAENAVLMTKKL